ncbi:MAG TPA: S1 RNA-binding domain-containing protein [Patescibacteria group bacterium]
MAKSQTIQTMEELVTVAGAELIPFRQGEVIEATVTQASKAKIMVDIAGLALGFIPEREFSYEANDLQVGDKVLAYVLSVENDEGYVVLSMKRAEKEQTWRMLEEKVGAGDFLTVKVVQANKGGLLVRFGDVEGFIPVSQLSSQTLGRIPDRDKLTARLNELIGQALKVKAITSDKAANRLIFSEKAVANVETEAKIKSLKPGDTVKGKITGIVDFGIFMDIGGVEGLVHISEVAWERIDDLKSKFAVGDELDVQIIEIDGNRVSLSVKRLLPDPWAEAVKAYNVGQVVTGEVTRVTPFGAFVKFDAVLDGLVRVNEIVDAGQNPTSILEVGKTYSFKILSIDPAARQIGLSYKQAQ